VAHPNDETLGFSALMIAPSENTNTPKPKVTLIIITHSNINTSDIYNTFNNISAKIYRTFCYHKFIALVIDL
jgi:hypothetical protein